MNIVITGGTGALGTSVVQVMLARGFDVHLPIVEAELPAHVPWRADPRVHATKLSLDNEAQVTAFYAAISELWGSIHLVGGFAMAPIASTTLADFEQQWKINTVTCFLGCREAVKAMRRGAGAAAGSSTSRCNRPVVVAGRRHARVFEREGSRSRR